MLAVLRRRSVIAERCAASRQERRRAKKVLSRMRNVLKDHIARSILESSSAKTVSELPCELSSQCADYFFSDDRESLALSSRFALMAQN